MECWLKNKDQKILFTYHYIDTVCVGGSPLSNAIYSAEKKVSVLEIGQFSGLVFGQKKVFKCNL